MRWDAVISLVLLLLPFPAEAQYELPEPSYAFEDHSPVVSGSMLPVQLSRPSHALLMPQTDLVISYNLYRAQMGVTVPEQSISSRMMPVNNAGFMAIHGHRDYGIGLTGSRNMYPSLGMSNTLSVGAAYSPADRITLYGSVYASDNMIHTTRFKDFGVSGSARIKVADRLYVNGFGEYSVYTTNSPHGLPPMGMYPGTRYGGSIEVKICDKIGIQGVVSREYDAFTRQWKTYYYATPVFY